MLRLQTYFNPKDTPKEHRNVTEMPPRANTSKSAYHFLFLSKNLLILRINIMLCTSKILFLPYIDIKQTARGYL